MKYPTGTTTGVYTPFRKHRKRKGRNLYNAKKVTCDGYTFDSKSEYHYYLQLKQQGYEHFTIHEPFEILPRFKLGKHIHRHRIYTPDFVVYDKDDNIIKVVDIKGMPKISSSASLRMEAFAWHYKIPITIARYDYSKGIFTEHEKK